MRESSTLCVMSVIACTSLPALPLPVSGHIQGVVRQFLQGVSLSIL